MPDDGAQEYVDKLFADHKVTGEEKDRFKFTIMGIFDAFEEKNATLVERNRTHFLRELENRRNYQWTDAGKWDHVPSIEELRAHYSLPPNVDLETIIRSRWLSGSLAPNGTRELLGWIFILIQMHKESKPDA